GGLVLANNFVATSTVIASIFPYASSTAISATNVTFVNSTTTSLGLTNLPAGSILKVTAGGAVVAATPGTDYLTSATIFSYPFSPPTQFGATSFGTSTLLGFTGGFVSSASSTIGGGAGNGLTVAGNATTTGTAYFSGRVGFGDFAPTSLFSIAATPTTTP